MDTSDFNFANDPIQIGQVHHHALHAIALDRPELVAL